jgi:hypothetical protein
MITRKSRRRMTQLAKRCAELHNDASTLARRLRNLVQDIQDFELGLAKEQREWFETEEKILVDRALASLTVVCLHPICRQNQL